jgi:outer membrane receptor protein involved in Fe transport
MQARALCLSASIIAIATGMSAADAARAADADQPVTTAPPAAPNTVAPLTITAERRTVNLQTAPIAASVIPGSQLQTEAFRVWTTCSSTRRH